MTFDFSSTANGYVSPVIELSGDTYLILSLERKGRVAVKKANSPEGPFPKIFVSPVAGPEFRLRLYGETQGKVIQVITTDPVVSCQIHNV